MRDETDPDDDLRRAIVSTGPTAAQRRLGVLAVVVATVVLVGGLAAWVGLGLLPGIGDRLDTLRDTPPAEPNSP